MNPQDRSDTSPKLILDTNISLDWLVFHDPSVQPVLQALALGQVRLIACPAIRDELSHMLRHPSLARWNVNADDALSHYDRHLVRTPPPRPDAAQRLSCSDPDDQVFIDLAITAGASWLLTHDRALLKLARRARALGVHVLRPQHWPGQGLIPGGSALPEGLPVPSGR